MFLEQFDQCECNIDEKQLKLNIELLASPMTLVQKKAATKVFLMTHQQGFGSSEMKSRDTPLTHRQPFSHLDEKPLKEMTITLNIYTISYFAFMYKNKEKFKLK
jgi:hypothetical protein